MITFRKYVTRALYCCSLLFCFSDNIHAQPSSFEVDCGNDTFFCVGLYTDSFNIGSHLKIRNGTPPYSYSWNCKSIKVSDNLTFTTSDFLNDTSIDNPYLIDYGLINKPWYFYLSVKDINNNVASDSLAIFCSRFTYRTKEYGFNLHIGDSIQFYDEIFVGGGIPPISYYWSPSTGLDDSTKINAWCKPSHNTNYSQYIIDSVGCISYPNRAYNITILPTSGIDNRNQKSTFNLYQVGERVCFTNPFNDLAKLSIYSINGELLYAGETRDAFFDIPDIVGKNNIIICVLTIEGIKAALKIY
jgi:hypothetical protein